MPSKKPPKPVVKNRKKPAPPATLIEDGQAALAALRPRLDRLPASRLQPPRFDIEKAATFALAIAQKVNGTALRARFDSLPSAEFDPRHLDDLSTIARATLHAAQAVQRSDARATEARVPWALAKEASALRERLLRLCEYYFADHETLSAELRDIRRGQGYLDLASDLDRLAALLHTQRDTLSRDPHLYRKTDAADASRLAAELRAALGESGPSSPKKDAAARDTLRRCLCLLQDTYSEVAAAAHFLLRHDPARAQFPSLGQAAHHTTPKKRKSPPPPAPPAPTAPPSK